MTTAEARSAFLSFFEARQHRIVPSDSLIPSTDPTLLFTSAGMVQFKPYFQKASAASFRRAASCQKCLRTSDIENVGHTLRHLTFFEMLGNFSFGDYFKKEAIGWGWEFLTKTLALPGDRFTVSVHREDNEAFHLWKAMVPEDRIVRLGDDTNFWTMGPTGPCGPCSEILWDRGISWSCGKSTCGPACDCDRYLEIWNLVFTQFDRSSDGNLQPLPQKNIDTGMGLERLCVLLQNVSSPFSTDAFQPIFHALANVSGRDVPVETNEPSQDPLLSETAAFRRISDHSRAITCMIADGILPSNEGRGYVLRRLLRQAVRAGKTLGLKDPFLYRLTGIVIDTLQKAYPETLQRRETVASVVKMEEEKFLETLETGTRLLEDLVSSAKSKKMTTLPGKELFRLHDTYGFPFELTKEMAEGFGLQVDSQGFESARKQAVELARQAWKGSGARDIDRYRPWQNRIKNSTTFRGYETLEVKGVDVLTPLMKRQGESWLETDLLVAGEEGEIVLDQTPFYPEGGGQVGDTGWFQTDEAKAEVLDTQSPLEGFIVHRVRVTQGALRSPSKIIAKVDPQKREATMRHHTATHLLHKALRQVLGPHVTQSGSLVAPDRLRFDFTHYAALSREQRQRVEDLVNEQIIRNFPVQPHEVSIREAQAVGAMALFGEKYGERVRCVMVSPLDWSHAHDAWSLELCGGTHVNATGQIGLFKFLSEAAISAGVRRIEAVAGWPALQAIRRMEHQLATVAETLKATPEELLPRIDRLLTQERELEKEVQGLKSHALRAQFDEILKTGKSIGGMTLIRHRLDGLDVKQLREVADRLKDSSHLGLVILATAHEEKVSFVISAAKEVAARGVHAGHLAKEFAELIQGSGGGRADFAQGGGKNVSHLDQALSQVDDLIKKMAVKTSHKTA